MTAIGQERDISNVFHQFSIMNRRNILNIAVFRYDFQCMLRKFNAKEIIATVSQPPHVRIILTTGYSFVVIVLGPERLKGTSRRQKKCFFN